MHQDETALAREDVKACVKWILSEIGARVPSNHQMAPFVAAHMARWTVPEYLRGSDRSERLFASFQILERAGYTHKEAVLTVAEHAPKVLRKPRRGSPNRGNTGGDFFREAESVRRMVNAFKKRTRDTESAVRFWIGQFLWGREIGVIKGSEFDADAGQRMFEDRLDALRQMRLRGFVWPTPPPRAGRFADSGSE
jgi:hypothetical protein